jgi:AcrR family transcriptional regulator
MFTETEPALADDPVTDPNAPSRRDREKAQVTARILNAARDLLAKGGEEAVTLRAVAEAIEYTPPAIYAHFPDKQALMAAVLMDDFARLGRSFAELANIKDPIQRIELIGRAYIKHAADHPRAFELLMLTRRPAVAEGAKQPCTDTDPSQNAYALLHATVKEAVAMGLAKGGNRDTELLTQTLWAGVHGVAALAVIKGEAKAIDWRPLQARTDCMVHAMIEGLFVGPRKAAAGAQGGEP